MKRLIEKHKPHWMHKPFLNSVILGLLLLFLSLVVNYNAVVYTTSKAGNAVSDLILDNLPVMNVDFVFTEGALIFILFLASVLLLQPKYIPFVIKSVAVFILVRSFSIILTHIGPIPDQTPLDLGRFARLFTYDSDLFFSGHTGLPYLMALVFWRNKLLSRIFLAVSILAGIGVLLGHIHYSIDVFAAFFITFGIFHISKWLFKNDYEYTNV